MKLLAALLLLSLPALAKPCRVKGLEKVTVPAGVDCAAFAEAFDIAHSQLPYLTELPAGQVDRALRKVRVEVTELEVFPCGAVQRAVGCWTAKVRTVRVTSTAASLLHELLHVLEPHGTQEHLGWADKGWETAVRAYYDSATPLTAAPPAPPPAPPLQSSR